jgi:hypothetical protein
MGRQPRANGGVSVSPPAIPEDDEGAAHMAREMAKEAQDLRTSKVAVRVQGQRQSESVTPRRDDQGANAGDLLMRARTHGHRRASRHTAPRCGGARASSRIPFHRGRSGGGRAAGVFFTPTQSCLTHSRTRRSSHSFGRGWVVAD